MKRLTLKDCQAKYEQTLYRKASWRAYAKMLDRMVYYLDPDNNRAPEDILRSDVLKLKEWLQKEYKLSFKTTNYYLRVGKYLYNFLDQNSLVPMGYNPFKAFGLELRFLKRMEQDEKLAEAIDLLI